MVETGYVAVFLIGLLGGVHCVGMCGGIVGALTLPLHGGVKTSKWPTLLAYNFGRICTYAATGATVGALGSASLLFNRWLPFQLGLYVLANVMLILLGFYLMGFSRVLAPIERLGHRIWAKIQPATKRFLPVKNWRQALPLGMLWGFLPCGLTYTIFSMALVSGSAFKGATMLLVFGLGTLPNLLLAGVLMARFRAWVQRRVVRVLAGCVMMGMGVFGLLQVQNLGARLWQGVMC